MSSIKQKEKESFLADLHVGVLSLIAGTTINLAKIYGS